MKTQLIIALIGLAFSLNSQQTIKGKYILSGGQMSLTFHPLDNDNSYGYPWYEVEYQNGYKSSAGYLIQNDYLTLGSFNYGKDQSFKIIQNNENALVLESTDMYPVQRFQLNKQRNENIAQRHKGSNKILATINGMNYTSEHFAKELNFAEFVLGTKLPDSEIKKLKREAISEFEKDPANDLKTIKETDNSMQQLYRIKDLTKIGLARNYFIAQLYPAIQQMDDQSFFKKLFFKYNNILAEDKTNGMVLTASDLNAYFDLMNFYAKLMGQNNSLDYNSRNQYKQQIITKFREGDNAFNTYMCVMNVLNQYTQNTYNNLTEEQKQQFSAGLFANTGTVQYTTNDAFQQGYNSVPDYTKTENLWPEGVTTKAQKQAYLAKMRRRMSSNAACFDIMNSMMMNSHALGLNIADMNNSSYWEVKSY